MRILALLMALLVLFTFVACGSSEEQSTAESKDVSEATSEAVSETNSETSTEEESTEESIVEDSSEAVESSDAGETSEEESSEAPEDESSEAPEGPEEVRYDPLKINKVSGAAPVVDGEVSDKEYATAIKFNMDKKHWSFDSSDGADAYDIVLYLSWDETYLYSAVAVRVGKPRTYDNTDFTQNRPYIFDRRHVMTAVVTGDPTDPKYLPPSGTAWDWGAAYNSGLGSEWSITAQPDGSNIHTDHFGAVTKSPNYQYKVAVSKLETEIYEQRIPWADLAGGKNFVPEAGAVIGYAFSCCCEEVDITVDSDPNAIYACFGGGIIGGKNFCQYVGMTLKD